jgi:predicted metal-dependent hydrolase
MPDKTYTIKNMSGITITVNVRRDKRLKKSSRWEWQSGGAILLRVPHRLPNRVIRQQIDAITTQLDRREKLADRRTDAELNERASYINQKYFAGVIQWNAIRWVSNMNTRLGSCTNGGTTDGHIRISDKIKNWPQWVVDYVISHELVHRMHPHHNKDFWHTLTEGYPMTERARGFIHGVGFAEGTQFEDE